MKYISVVLFSLIFLASCGAKEQVQETPETGTQETIQTNTSDTLTTSEEDALINDVLSGVVDETAEMNSSEAMAKEVEKEKMMKDSQWTQEEMDAMKTEKSSDTMIKEDTMKKEVSGAGVYANYSPALVGKTKNTVIFFHANWCPSCRALDAGITSGTLPDGLTVLKADYDTEKELKKKYGVLSQHTLVYVDAQGNEIKKWAGGSTIESITEKLN